MDYKVEQEEILTDLFTKNIGKRAYYPRRGADLFIEAVAADMALVNKFIQAAF